MPRRFPTAWSAERIPGSFVVQDAIGQSLAYVYASETSAFFSPPRYGEGSPPVGLNVPVFVVYCKTVIARFLEQRPKIMPKALL